MHQNAAFCGNGLILHQTTKFTLYQKTKLNLYPNNKILALAKLKAFADDKFNVAKMVSFFSFDKVENIVGNREWLPAFSPFLTIFLALDVKVFTFGVVL